MPPVFLEERLGDESHLGEKPRQQRQFEDDSHDEYEHQEVAHIGSQRNLIDDRRAELVFREEAEREGENQTVAHGASQEEHARAEDEGPADVLFLVVEQRGLHEPPDFENQVGEHEHQREPERRADMGQELRGDVDVDDLHMVVVVAEVGEEGAQTAQFREPAVQREIGGRRCQHDVIEQVGHGAEADDHEQEQDGHHADQYPAQRFEVSPERHILVFHSFLAGFGWLRRPVPGGGNCVVCGVGTPVCGPLRTLRAEKQHLRLSDR